MNHNKATVIAMTIRKAFIFIIICLFSLPAFSQEDEDIDVYLLTCGPGHEVYEHWGHSALRIVSHKTGKDIVCNWGIFDFSTKNFAWQFAKGRLDYMLGLNSYQSFINSYASDNRWVLSQQINLNNEEKKTLLALIKENLKPENIKYKYDFFYDNCATRIRDILETAVGSKLLYPPVDPFVPETFRDITDSYLTNVKWLNFGIDFLLGLPADKKAGIRERMFIPNDLKDGLSEVDVNRNGNMIPLLQNPVIITYAQPTDPVKQSFFNSPVTIFSLILIIVLILSTLLRSKTANRILDIIIFLIYSLLAGLMLFSNFCTDHTQMAKNLNIIWLNPIIILCLFALIINKKWEKCFRIVFYLCLAFFFVLIFFHNIFSDATIPLLLILLVRSLVRSDFDKFPFSISHLTQL